MQKMVQDLELERSDAKLLVDSIVREDQKEDQGKLLIQEPTNPTLITEQKDDQEAD